jgi:hypothetical protein
MESGSSGVVRRDRKGDGWIGPAEWLVVEWVTLLSLAPASDSLTARTPLVSLRGVGRPTPREGPASHW